MSQQTQTDETDPVPATIGRVAAPPAETAADEGDVRQFITFDIADEEYGVDIMAVREIKAWEGVTRLPNTPGHMRGVINLRGVVVPIFDMRARFGMGETEPTKIHVVVIVAIGERLVGILVDAVSDILAVGASQIQAVPKLDRCVDRAYLSGLVSLEGRMVALLDVSQLFELDDMELTGGDAMRRIEAAQ